MADITVNSVNSATAALLATLGAIMFIQHLTVKANDLRWIWSLRQLFSQAHGDRQTVHQSPQNLVDEEMNSVRLVHFTCIQQSLLHITWITMLGEYAVAAQEQTAIHFFWVVSVTLCYLAFMHVDRSPITADGARRMCIALQIMVILGNMSTALGPFDRYICLHVAEVTFHLNLSVIMADVYTSIPLSFCFCASTILSYAARHGTTSISGEFLMLQGFELWCFMMVPGLIESTARKRIDLAMQSKMANLMVSGFRRMIKGLCDGDLLLDTNFCIRGSSACLQRMLGTTREFSGVVLMDLMVEESKQRFIDFIDSSRDEDPGAPRCLRVAFKGHKVSEVSVDLFHVAMPDLHVPGNHHHIIALAEDVQPSPLPEAVPPAQDPPLLTHKGAPAPVEGDGISARGSATSCAEAVESFQELIEMNLFLDPYQKDDAFLDDIREAHFKFERKTSLPRISRGMPTLKRYVHPSDWETVDAYVEQVVSRIRTTPPKESGEPAECPALDLGPLLLRLPGETRAYLYARSVKVSSGIASELPSSKGGQPPASRLRVQLHVSEFYTGKWQRKE